MNGLLDILIDIASTPAILVALIAVLGSVLQKKSTTDIVKGGVKTFVGFLVVTAGAGVIVGALAPFGEMFKVAFNMQGVIPNNEAIVAVALDQYGTSTALIMLSGMIFNILIARFTKFKYIFLTGHHTLVHGVHGCRNHVRCRFHFSVAYAIRWIGVRDHHVRIASIGSTLHGRIDRQ